MATNHDQKPARRAWWRKWAKTEFGHADWTRYLALITRSFGRWACEPFGIGQIYLAARPERMVGNRTGNSSEDGQGRPQDDSEALKDPAVNE